MDLGLKDKVVAITGASKGIGYASAETFLKEGARVAICARTAETLEEAADRLREDTGGEVLAVQADLSKRPDAKRFMQAVFDHFGRLDIVVNCAGSSPGGLLEDITEEQWMESMGLKFMGYVRGMTEAMPFLRKSGGGSIVNVIGNDGVKPIYFELTPSAANAADIAITQALAEQYGPQNIRINAVNPGPVATDRWDGLEKQMAVDKGITQEEAHNLAVRSLPLGRICTAQEVANVVVFVASDCASYMNGASITVDGGQRKALMDTNVGK
jgi:NAD(P)-dependent dehydrogenase (short-subunit alcohol dehydrogenase family)